MQSFITFIESVEKDLDENFSAIIGNPPYSIFDGKISQTYAAHYFQAKKLSPKYLSMIFPAEWQTVEGLGNEASMKKIREDKNLLSVNNFKEYKDKNPQIFPDYFIGPISIVLAGREHDSETVEFSEYSKILGSKSLLEVRHWNDETDNIFTKLEKWRKDNEISSIVSRISPNGVHLSNKDFLKYSELDSLISFKKNSEWMSCWGYLPDGEYGWSWIDPDHSSLTLDQESFEANKYKVFFGVDCGAYAIWRKANILGPNSVFASEFIGVYFDKLESARNFRNFLKTNFYRFITSETGSTITTGRSTQRFVPNLEKVINPRTNKVGWDSDWSDEDLKRTFEGVLSQGDWRYISDRVLLSDGYKGDVDDTE